MSWIVSGAALRSFGRVCALNERIEGGERAQRSSGHARQPPAPKHPKKDQLSLRAQGPSAAAARHGSSRKTPHRAGIWVLGPGRRWTGRQSGVGSGGARKQQQWERTALPSTATIKQHSATSGPLGTEADVRKERKKQPRVARWDFLWIRLDALLQTAFPSKV